MARPALSRWRLPTLPMRWRRMLPNTKTGKRLFGRSEEHTSELQSLMRISYAVFCLKKKITKNKHIIQQNVSRLYNDIQSTIEIKLNISQHTYHVKVINHIIHVFMKV